MVPCEEESWKRILARVEETEADGIELNFGCPHGMSERGMGSAVGQVPEYVEMVTRWCKQHSRMPVIVKLTPNVTDILRPGARGAGAAARMRCSLINTVMSITGVDLDNMAPRADGGRAMAPHGGYCGPAVKPIALRMVGDIARDQQTARLPISGIGGISHLARRRRVHRARRRHGAGLHRRDASRLPHRRGHDRRAFQLDGRARATPRIEDVPRPRRAAITCTGKT